MELQELLTRFPSLVNALEKIHGQSRMDNGISRDTGITDTRHRTNIIKTKNAPRRKMRHQREKMGHQRDKNETPE